MHTKEKWLLFHKNTFLITLQNFEAIFNIFFIMTINPTFTINCQVSALK